MVDLHPQACPVYLEFDCGVIFSERRETKSGLLGLGMVRDGFDRANLNSEIIPICGDLRLISAGFPRRPL